MTPRMLPGDIDPAEPAIPPTVAVQVDGCRVEGLQGQTLAGMLLAAGRDSWRRTRRGHDRGVFCGIGVCFDCLVTVNGVPDVRACQRRAHDGDIVELQGGDE